MADKTDKSGIKSWPQDDRPREKLLKKGAGPRCLLRSLFPKLALRFP